MTISSSFNSLPKSTKNSLVLGIVLALAVALPLFVWTAINVNFNVREKAADDGSNYCGGTCGSNYNCQPNLYCYKGFCRNPLCSDDTDCSCNLETPTSSPITAVSKASSKPTLVATASPTILPKGGIDNYGNLINQTPLPATEATPETVTTNSVSPENQFFAKYAIYIFGAFTVIVILSIVYAIKKSKDTNIPHILPPTNI